MIAVTHKTDKGEIVRDSFGDAVKVKTKSDGLGCTLQVLYDNKGRIVAGFVTEQVLQIEVTQP